MANTTNLNLVKPAGTDYALVSVINGNMDIIDNKVGAIPQNESVQSQITALNNQIAKFTASDIKSSLSSQYGAIGGARGISIGTFRVIELDISISTQVPKYGDIITGLPGANTNNIPIAMTNNTSGEVHYASITATGVLYAMFNVIPTGSYRINLAYIGA